MITAADIKRLTASAPLGKGYHFELLERSDVPTLIGAIAEWFPDISIGGASCYLREDFYARKVFFADAPQQSNIVLVLMHGEELAGMFACDLDSETQSIYAGLGVAAPQHRGAKLAQAGILFTEALGRYLNMGFVFGFATLKNIYAQVAFERADWQLVGIMPGYDRELVSPGVVKRVFEAMYAKVLASDVGLLRPLRQNLTPRTQQFFDCIFATQSPPLREGSQLAEMRV